MYVQGASLKTGAVFLMAGFSTPRSSGRESEVMAIKSQVRLQILALLMTLVFQTSAKASSGDLIIRSWFGRCSLSINGKQLPCIGIAYMVVGDRGDFIALNAKHGSALSFSGGQDFQISESQYLLHIDQVIYGAATELRSLPVNGVCEADISENAKLLRRLSCRTTSGLGRFILTASGYGRGN